jgi:protein involved in polysaccharide export with SLBB domain
MHKGKVPMNGVIRKATTIIVILLFVSCFAHVSSKVAHFVNLEARESRSNTMVILTTSEPVQYKDTKLENPPCILINFPEKKIFSSEEDVVIVNKGPIKRIRNEYYQSEGEGPRQLNLVIVELTQDLPYKISSSGSSILIRIENPKESELLLSKEAKKIGGDSQARAEEPLSETGYLIGPGDVLNIEVWNHPDVSRDVVVDDRGEIKLPPVRRMSVMAFTTYQLEEELTKFLSVYLIDPIVFVTIKEFNSQRIIALGEITSGMYSLKRRTTLVELLGEIGGPTANADVSRIKLIKKDGQVFTYDLNELINDPKKGNEGLVSGGDTIFVPPLELQRISVLGQVNNPKMITVKGKLTLVEAITQAGGFNENAVKSSVVVLRGELGALKGYRVDMNRILKKGDIGLNIELEPGDIVYVPKSFIADIERFLRDVSLPLTWYFWYLK